MSQFNSAIFAIIAATVFCVSTSVFSLPVINCEPNSMSEAPTNIRQLCYYVMESLRSEPLQENTSDMIANRLTERGIKRQDVDHVFLRFGKRFGL